MIYKLFRLMFRYKIPGTTRLLAFIRGKDGTIPFDTSIGGKNLCLHLCPSDYVDRQVMQFGYYEKHVLDELLTAPENAIVWDIGANIGLHTAAIASFRTDIDVVAVEANPLLAKRLLANVGAYQNVKVYVCGLSETFALLPFSILSSWNSGLSSFRPWGDVPYERVVHISTVPASTIPSAPPDFVKIDVEGYELEVLRGFGLLLSGVKKYVIETSYPEAILELLGKDKYSYRQVGPAEKPDYVFERLSHL